MATRGNSHPLLDAARTVEKPFHDLVIALGDMSIFDALALRVIERRADDSELAIIVSNGCHLELERSILVTCKASHAKAIVEELSHHPSGAADRSVPRCRLSWSRQKLGRSRLHEVLGRRGGTEVVPRRRYVFDLGNLSAARWLRVIDRRRLARG